MIFLAKTSEYFVALKYLYFCYCKGILSLQCTLLYLLTSSLKSVLALLLHGKCKADTFHSTKYTAYLEVRLSGVFVILRVSLSELCGRK